MSWLCVFLGFSPADHPPRGRALRRRQGDRDAGRALLPLLRAEAGLGQARRDRVRDRRDPARRLREDHRHEPGRGAAAGGSSTAATTDQPVWKRIVVIGAGPAVNIVLAFAILFVVFLPTRQQADPDGRARSTAGTPAGGELQPRATGSSRSTAVATRARPAKSGSNASATRSPRTTAPASRSTAAVAATPVDADGRARRRRARPSSCGPTTTPQPSRDPARLLLRRPSASDLGAGEAAGRAVDSMWLVTDEDGRRLRPHLRSRTAQAGLRRRRRQRRRQPGDRRSATERGAAPARRRQPLARPDQPLPVPAARRRPHLLEPGREGARQAGPVLR